MMLDSRIGALPRYGKAKREAQIGVTATTFLALSIWIGPDRAVFLFAVVAIVAIWIASCHRWPLVAVFTIGVVRGLLRR
jgi:hypothetical protein